MGAVHERQDICGCFRNIRTRPEDGGDPRLFQVIVILCRDNATADHEDICRSLGLERVDELRHVRRSRTMFT
jgi:hypothetical protein